MECDDAVLKNLCRSFSKATAVSPVNGLGCLNERASAGVRYLRAGDPDGGADERIPARGEEEQTEPKQESDSKGVRRHEK